MQQLRFHRKCPAPEVGAGIAATGAAEAISNFAGHSLLDALGSFVIANTPMPIVERTIRHLGVTDKPFLRGGVGAVLALGIGMAVPSRRRGRAQVALAAGGAVVAGIGRARLNAIERARHESFRLPPVAHALGEARDGAERWRHAEPLFTEVGRFYRTDVNLRPPSVRLDSWSLTVSGGSGRSEIGMQDLLGMKLRERDALLVCVHNRPGWDRLGQQRWTGIPIREVLETAAPLPEHPDHYDLVTGALDGYEQVIPLDIALEARAWIVIGMAGRALPLDHGFPARVMTPGIVGQYNGAKWLSELRVVERGSRTSWWGRRRSWLGESGWPRRPVWVPPMARVDHPATTGMPPRLPPRAVRVGPGPVPFVGTAWAPPHGVKAVELRVNAGEWMDCELARELNGDSWRRWRREVELPSGEIMVEARCRGSDGSVQAGIPKEPFPCGVGAYHKVSLIVTS